MRIIKFLGNERNEGEFISLVVRMMIMRMHKIRVLWKTNSLSKGYPTEIKELTEDLDNFEVKYLEIKQVSLEGARERSIQSEFPNYTLIFTAKRNGNLNSIRNYISESLAKKKKNP